jgi:hypothetical protein
MVHKELTKYISMRVLGFSMWENDATRFTSFSGFWMKKFEVWYFDNSYHAHIWIYIYIRIPYFAGYLRLATQLCFAFLHRVRKVSNFFPVWAGLLLTIITGVPLKKVQHFRIPDAALSDSWQRSANALECGIVHGFSQVVLVTFDHSILITYICILKSS